MSLAEADDVMAQLENDPRIQREVSRRSRLNKMREHSTRHRDASMGGPCSLCSSEIELMTSEASHKGRHTHMCTHTHTRKGQCAHGDVSDSPQTCDVFYTTASTQRDRSKPARCPQK